MRILHIPEIIVPKSENRHPEPPPPDTARIEALDHRTQSILQKLENIEERLHALEENRNPPAINPEPAPPSTPEPPPQRQPPAFTATPVSLDAEAVKKGLLTKMWKYLNDERPENPI